MPKEAFSTRKFNGLVYKYEGSHTSKIQLRQFAEKFWKTKGYSIRIVKENARSYYALYVRYTGKKDKYAH